MAESTPEETVDTSAVTSDAQIPPVDTSAASPEGTPPAVQTPEEITEEERRTWQSETEKAKAKARVYEDMINEGVYVHRDQVAPVIQQPAQQEPAKAPQDFLNAGEEFVPEEVNTYGTPSFQAMESWREHRQKLQLNDTLNARDQQAAEQQRINDFNSQVQDLISDKGLGVTEQEITHFQTVFLPQLAKHINVRDTFNLYRTKMYGASPPTTQTVRPNSAAPVITPVTPPAKDSERYEMLREKYKGCPAELAQVELMAKRGQI